MTQGSWQGPDFLVIGAAKSGTTALDEYLRQHPDLWFPEVREPNHWAFRGSPPTYRDHRGKPAALVHTTVWEPGAYRDLFADAPVGAVCGETSPAYLYVEGTADRVAAARPDVRLVAILREPGARAFSAYQHLVREGREPLSFSAALDAEPARIQQDWGLLWRYIDTGRYAAQLQRWLDVVDDEQLLVLRHGELRDDATGVCRRVFAHLGVDAEVEVDTSLRHNASGVPRNRLLHRLTTPPASLRRAVQRLVPAGLADRLRQAQAAVATRNLERATADPDDLARVRRALAEDTDRLRQLTGWPLEHWPRGD